jgi:hypothetical protein
MVVGVPGAPKGLWPACVAVSIGLHACALWAGFIDGPLQARSIKAGHAEDAAPPGQTEWLLLLPTAARARATQADDVRPDTATRARPDTPSTAAPTQQVAASHNRPKAAGTGAESPAAASTPGIPPPVYWRPDEVDKIALPLTDLDAQLLNGMLGSGLPIRLRVYIDARGHLADVQAVQSLPEDQDAVAKLTAMLRAARFTPARRAGQDVASVQALEFTFENVLVRPAPPVPPVPPSSPVPGR